MRAIVPTRETSPVTRRLKGEWPSWVVVADEGREELWGHTPTPAAMKQRNPTIFPVKNTMYTEATSDPDNPTNACHQ